MSNTLNSPPSNFVFTGVDRLKDKPSAPNIDSGLVCNANYVWNTDTASWVRATQSTQSNSTRIQDSSGNNLESTDGSLNVHLSSMPVTPVTGTFWQSIQPVSGTVGISGTVPVSGTFWQVTQPVSLTSLPSLPVGSNLIGAVTVSGAVSTVPPVNASNNITQFGGSNLVTGIGASGAGIPRITVSSDSWPAIQSVSANSLPLPSGASRQPIFSSIVIPTPAPGPVNYKATVPNGVQWKICTVYFRLTAGSTVANRFIFCFTTDALGNRLSLVYCTVTQPASTTWEYSLNSNSVPAYSNTTFGFNSFNIPASILGPGASLSIGGFSIQATDQFSNLSIGAEVINLS